MENILEMLYDLPREKVHGQDSPFVRTARIKSENLELLTASMTDEQKELLDAYLMDVASLPRLNIRRRGSGQPADSPS